ncbi:MAG: hypothetical protein AB3X44_17660 [Leptothrix sp. (in: b-proteobacteria)]
MDMLNPTLNASVATPDRAASPHRAAARNAAAAIRSVRPAPNRRGQLLYLVLGGLIGLAWGVTQLELFEPGDDVGYWLGVVGGVMMLALLLYPLRKYISAFRGWGKMKSWLWVHMVLGIGGPLLILLHCTFRVGSLNAAMALYSMIIVALSGIVGRFLYVRVHRGLETEKAVLRELRQGAGLGGKELSRLWFAPAVESQLGSFEAKQLAARPGLLGWCHQALVLPVLKWHTQRACLKTLRPCLQEIARGQHWSGEDLQRRSQVSAELVDHYLAAVVRVAQFSAWQRLFKLWHVAHVPFVFLLVITGIVHVIAVHAY